MTATHTHAVRTLLLIHAKMYLIGARRKEKIKAGKTPLL
jgi:hypothetical protein